MNNHPVILHNNRPGALLLIALLVALPVLAACQPQGQNSPTPTPLPDARALLTKAADDIQTVPALRFKLQLTGAPAFVDTTNTISFIAADGSYVAPDKVAATVKAQVLGLPGQIEIVAIGDQQYMKHIVLTANKWLNQQFSPGFNADTLIRSEQGIKYALNSLQELKLVGQEDLFGQQVYHLSGISSVADISAVTVGLIRGTGTATADIYLTVDTGRVERIVLVQPDTVTAQNPEPTTWTMELFDYGKSDITIEIPQAEAPPTTTADPLGLPTPLQVKPTAEATQAP